MGAIREQYPETPGHLVSLFISAVSTTSIYQEVQGLHPELESVYEIYLSEMEHDEQSRQLGSVFVNSDATSGANIHVPIEGNDKFALSAVGAVGLDADRHVSYATGGLALNNVQQYTFVSESERTAGSYITRLCYMMRPLDFPHKSPDKPFVFAVDLKQRHKHKGPVQITSPRRNGHGASLTHTHIPKFGDQLTGAGHVNLLQNENHTLNASAFVTRNMPTIPQVPDFNTVGGSLDYMYKNKVGASLAASHTKLLQRTDYSATTNLNLLRNPSTSLEFNAGVSKSVSPFIKSSCEPKVGLTLRKFF